MRLWHRLVVVTVLAATACGSQDGLPGESPDSGTAISGNPDTAEPIASIDAANSGPDQPQGAALLSITPPSADLGCIDVGMTSPPVVVTVTNVGEVASGPLSVTATGDGFSATGCAGTVLVPRATCTISITSQTDRGPISGMVEVGDRPAMTKRVAVSGCRSYPSLYTLSPSPLDLGSVPVGESVSGVIALSHQGTQALTKIAIAANGAGFSLAPTGTCTTTLAPKQTCNIVVTYSAGSTPGQAKGSVSVSQGGVTRTVAVSATVMATLDPVDLTPSDNSVSGWMIDADSNLGGSKKPMTATTMDEGGQLIDGGIAPFYADGFSPKLFIWQNYANAQLADAPVDSNNPKGATLMLWVFRLSSTTEASGLYQNLLKFPEYTVKKTDTSSGWEEPTAPPVGTKSRIQDSGPDWRINFHKNDCYVEIRLTPSYSPAPDFTPSSPSLKNEALRFAQEVAAKL